MPFAQPQGPDIPLTHNVVIIALSLIIAGCCNLLPWRSDWLWLRPDFLLLTTLYWGIYQPRQIGIGTAWWLGLLVDLSDGAHLGQHALGYAISMYTLSLFQRRLYNFPPWQQAIPVLAFLLIEQVVEIVVSTFLGDSRDAVKYMLSAMMGAVCWLPLWWLMRRLRSRQPTRAS